MLIKLRPAPADPTKVCKTCRWYDPDLHVCCANDYAIFDEDANSMSCADWEPKKEKLNVFTTTETIGMSPINSSAHHDEPLCSLNPDPDANCRTCPIDCKRPAELQPDGSLKVQSRETIGATVMGQGITSATLHVRHCGNCLHQKGDEMCSEPGKPSDEGCKNWEPEPLKATVTFQYEEKQKPNDLEYAKHRKALDEGAKQGMTLEALDTVFAIACQQVPSMADRWQELRAELVIMLTSSWAKGEIPK